MQSFIQAARIQRKLQNEPVVETESTVQTTQPTIVQNEEKGIIEDASSTNPPESLEPFIATFDGPDDPLNPQNWPTGKKAGVTVIVSAIAFIVGFGSGVDTGVVPQACATFAVSDTAETLATALFLVGFGVGAPFAGPLSESYGRNPIYITTLALFCCWILGAALAPNFGAQLVFRFLAGVAGGTPLTTAGGTMADVFAHATRGKVFPFFACVAFVGPMTGPLVGAYIGASGIDWRWTEWVTLIVSGAILVVMLLFMPETNAQVILGWKARAMRQRDPTRDIRGPLEIGQSTLGQKLSISLTRPFAILATEPIVVAFTLYLSLVYVVSFSFFTSAPFIFGKTYGFSQGGSFLLFASIVVGLVICAAATPLFGMLVGREFRKAAAQGKTHADPEAMLIWAMIGAPLMPISLFWMGWTAFPSVSYWSPLISAAFFGFSVLCIFISTYAYLMQSYASYAASALVAITLVRYTASGAIVIVSLPMYKNLHVHDSLTVLAAISCAFTPIPYLLRLYGPRLRAASRRAVEPKH